MIYTAKRKIGIKSFKRLQRETLAAGGSTLIDLPVGVSYLQLGLKLEWPSTVSAYTPDLEVKFVRSGQTKATMTLSDLMWLNFQIPFGASTSAVDYALKVPTGIVYTDTWGIEASTGGVAGSTLYRVMLDLTPTADGYGGLQAGWKIEITDKSSATGGSFDALTAEVAIGEALAPGAAVLYNTEGFEIVSKGFKKITSEDIVECHVLPRFTSPVDAILASGTGKELLSLTDDGKELSPVGGWMAIDFPSTDEYALMWSGRNQEQLLYSHGAQVKLDNTVLASDGGIAVTGLLVR